jgi:hypothetical protein
VQHIFAGSWRDPKFPLLAIGLIAAVWGYQFLYESQARRVLECSPLRIALVVSMILYLCLVPGSGSQAFIYFQF